MTAKNVSLTIFSQVMLHPARHPLFHSIHSVCLKYLYSRMAKLTQCEALISFLCSLTDKAA